MAARFRKLTAMLLSMIMIMSGMNVFALSTSESGSSASSAGAGDGVGGGSAFGVQSVLPDDKTTGVPVNTGIEITFSDKGYADIDSLFSITPDVKGKFERHGKTVVFVPGNELKYSTVYTVTLKAGVKNSATGAITTEDTVFSFETCSKDDGKDIDDMKNPSWSVYFNNEYGELPASEIPRIRMSYYCNEESSDKKPDPQVEVYKFPDSKTAVNYLKNNGSRLWWTAWNNVKKAADINGYDKVGSFKLSERYDSKNHMMEFPFSLSEGFYAVNISYEGIVKQMILQINDLPTQVVSDGNKTVFWVNDVSTGKAASGAAVSVYGGASLGVTGGDGTLEINSGIDMEAFYQVVSGGRVNVIAPEYIRDSYYYGADDYYNGTSADYWTELQLDRSVFQKNDTVSFWGYASPRAAASGKSPVKVDKVTVAVSEGWYSQDILYKATVDVKNGSFSGKAKLPALDTGSYCLSVYRGSAVNAGDRLASEYFSVQKYVKPSYKIELQSDKKAVFPGDTVTLTARASFYEGTPAPQLDVAYNASSAFESRSGKTVTNADGSAVITEKVKTDGLDQGASWESVGVYAELPEKGKISASQDITVFTNDINVDIDAERDGKKASLKFKVNNITLDKINSSDSDYWNSGDELGAAVAGKKLDVSINRVYWEKVKTGTSYNYITKKTELDYRYDRHEEVIDSFSVTTGSDGKAEKSFSVPDREMESYYATVTCVDGNGRSMTFENYLGSYYDDYFWNSYRGKYYHLDGAQESYKDGDAVKLQLKYGDTVVNNGSCMFVEMQNGIRSYKAGKCNYSNRFSASDAPVKYIRAYYFNGYNYVADYGLYETLRFDYEGRRLDIDIKTDKESYEPGEKCTVTINVKSDGKVKKAHVNLAVVDEAVFSIEEYNVDTLARLYTDVEEGIKNSFATHNAYISGNSELEYGYSSGGSSELALDNAVSDTAGSDRGDGIETTESAVKKNDGDTERIREKFKDTAEFISIDTDANGKASYSFTMPDDITSWRFTASAISDDLYAGNETKQVSVTAPVILNYTLADSFMKGDKPSVGVSVYGKSVKNDLTVKYEVWDEAAPTKKYTALGKAFSRVNIPLWQMSETGHHALIIKASVTGGSSDTVKHEYDVVNTNRTVEKAEAFDVAAGMKFTSGSDSGINRVIFADAGRARYLSDIINLTYGSRMRLETALAGSEAAALTEKYFPDYSDYLTETGCDISKYQKSDGGMAILPYAASDIKATAQIIPLLIDNRSIDKDKLINYLDKKAESGSAAEKAQALYGLAVLGESVEAQLGAAAAGASNDTEANIYAALAYAELGNTDAAAKIYDAKLAPFMEKTDPYCRLKVSDDTDEIIDMTGASMSLAAALGRDEAEGMFLYCKKNHSKEFVTAAYEIIYIANAMEKTTAETGSVTYSLYGESATKEFGTADCGAGFVVSVPATAMDQLSVKSVEGSVKAVVISQTEASDIASSDNYVSVKRKYYKKGASTASNIFNQGDIVEVNVWVDYSKNALKGAYTVTDYLPAGLSYVDDSAITGGHTYDEEAMWWCENDGSKVEFYDYCAYPGKGRLYTYYARVISPGLFNAEGTTVQSAESAKAVYSGTTDKLTIK